MRRMSRSHGIEWQLEGRPPGNAGSTLKLGPDLVDREDR